MFNSSSKPLQRSWKMSENIDYARQISSELQVEASKGANVLPSQAQTARCRAR
ncbi:hypothetical protein OK016_02105 [Vibrio chagasii]|nr:hypothetical protein [Vibrio chagasii]